MVSWFDVWLSRCSMERCSTERPWANLNKKLIGKIAYLLIKYMSPLFIVAKLCITMVTSEFPFQLDTLSWLLYLNVLESMP